MAFGMQTASGDFRDIVKYDARAGRMFRVDKDTNGDKSQSEIPPGTQFALDLFTFEAGFVSFGPQGPVRHMVPYGGPGTQLPPAPAEKDDTGKLMFRPGFWCLIAGNAIGGVREWCSNAAVLLNAMDDLWSKVSAAPEAAAGKVPLVAISGTTPVTSGRGTTKSTNYGPIFSVTGWVPRPEQFGPATVTLGSRAPASAAPPPPVRQAAPVAPPPASPPPSAAAPAEMPF